MICIHKYKTLLIVALYFIFLQVDCYAQRLITQENSPVITDFSFKKTGKLPSQIPEASGLENSGDSIYWTHNDGGLSVLYGINQFGEIVKTIHLKNKNKGWEDLTFDQQDDLYIAATGNNKGDKTELKIYKIPNPNKIDAPITLAETISFRYEDQISSEVNPANMNFDSDAILALGDSLYIFSKNRTSPYNGIVNIYVLPTKAGTYLAKKYDSFQLAGNMFDNWITGADVTEDGTLVALLFHRKILFIEKSKGQLFSEGNFTWLNLGHFSHKAGVSFQDRETLFIVDELELDVLGGNIYKLNLQRFKD